jgi:hypothetical protein
MDTTHIPYEEVTRPSLGIFSGLPSASPDSVLVIDREGKPLRVLASYADRLTAGEARFGRIRTLYRVTMTERTLTSTQAYPCQDAGAFLSTMQLTWRIVDPEAVVRRGIHDVRAVLLPPVTETIRAVCRNHPAEHYADAESAALTTVRGCEAEAGHDAAFRITAIALTLTLDPDAEAFVKQLKSHARTGALATSQAQLDQLQTQHEAELALQRQRLAAEQEKQAAEFERERLKLLQLREKQEAQLAHERMLHEEELARERLTLQLERERLAEAQRLDLDRARADHYLTMLDRGEFAAMALQLAQEPAAIDRVRVELAHRRGVQAQQQLQALQMFLEHDALEAMDIGDKAKAVLAQLVDGWARGTPQLEVAAEPAKEIIAGNASKGTGTGSTGTAGAAAAGSNDER